MAEPAADRRRRDLPDQRQHRRVHAVGGEQRRAGIQQARPRHHRIGLRLAGRQRRAQRHIGRALLVPGVDDAQARRRRAGRRRTGGRCARPAARRRYRCPCAISVATVASAVDISAVAGLGFFRTFGLRAWTLLPACADRRGQCADCARSCRAAKPCLDKADPHALFARLVHHAESLCRNRLKTPMHRYRSHTCGALREGDIGKTVRLSGWCHRIRDHGGVLFIDLRDHYGITQVVADPDSPAFKLAETLRSEWVVRIDGKVRQRPEGTVNPGAADRPGRGLYRRDRGARRRRRTADAGVRRAGLSGGDPAQIPLPRSAPREAARQHHAARARHQLDPPAHEGGGLLRIPDADPHRLVAGRRARLSGAVAHASGQILRAAAGAAAVQAAHHGGGLRPLFPDRALLPRRGRARRPLARRVLPARSGDELRHASRTCSTRSSR